MIFHKKETEKIEIVVRPDGRPVMVKFSGQGCLRRSQLPVYMNSKQLEKTSGWTFLTSTTVADPFSDCSSCRSLTLVARTVLALDTMRP